MDVSGAHGAMTQPPSVPTQAPLWERASYAIGGIMPNDMHCTGLCCSLAYGLGCAAEIASAKGRTQSSCELDTRIVWLMGVTSTPVQSATLCYTDLCSGRRRTMPGTCRSDAYSGRTMNSHRSLPLHVSRGYQGYQQGSSPGNQMPWLPVCQGNGSDDMGQIVLRPLATPLLCTALYSSLPASILDTSFIPAHDVSVGHNRTCKRPQPLPPSSPASISSQEH